jgi:hypothetical protein
VGHECVRSEIAIVFGGEESRDGTLTLNLISIVFDTIPQNTERAASRIIATAVPILRFAEEFQLSARRQRFLFAKFNAPPNTDW